MSSWSATRSAWWSRASPTRCRSRWRRRCTTPDWPAAAPAGHSWWATCRSARTRSALSKPSRAASAWSRRAEPRRSSWRAACRWPRPSRRSPVSTSRSWPTSGSLRSRSTGWVATGCRAAAPATRPAAGTGSSPTPRPSRPPERSAWCWRGSRGRWRRRSPPTWPSPPSASAPVRTATARSSSSTTSWVSPPTCTSSPRPTPTCAARPSSALEAVRARRPDGAFPDDAHSFH